MYTHKKDIMRTNYDPKIYFQFSSTKTPKFSVKTADVDIS